MVTKKAPNEWKEWKSGDTLTRSMYKQDEFTRRVDDISQNAKDKTEDIRNVLSRSINEGTMENMSQDFGHQQQYSQQQSGLKGGKTKTQKSGIKKAKDIAGNKKDEQYYSGA
jgi:hypothetical protein